MLRKINSFCRVFIGISSGQALCCMSPNGPGPAVMKLLVMKLLGEGMNRIVALRVEQ